MGRRVAGKSFLDAWTDRKGSAALHCYAGSRQHFKNFCDIAKARGATGTASWIPHANPERLRNVGALYYPGPDIGTQAWRRFKRGPQAWSLVGITHTICTKTILDGVCDWATAPVEPWDAVICTSKAAHDAIAYQLAAQREHLGRRLGATRFTDPQMPIIPLGIHVADFAPDAQLRARMRAQLQIGEDEIAILFVGRLDRFGKAHPAPMLTAVQRAAAASGKTVRLLLAGQFVHEAARKLLHRDVAAWAPNLQVQILDGRDAALCAGAWRAADIFVSLVDNIQETFGLTPVEAMAAGLPVVVSDWDGYRDTVREGVDGFRIRSIIPPAALGEAAIDRYAVNIDSYGTYLARTASMVVIDIAAATAALVRLIGDAGLRRDMGAAGRARAAALYDWRVVLDAYQALLDELAARRAAAAGSEQSAVRLWPARLSPFAMFAGFATHQLRGRDLVQPTPGVPAEVLNHIAVAESAVIGNPEAFLGHCRRLLQALNAPMTVAALLQDEADREPVLRALLILAKFGVVTIRTV